MTTVDLTVTETACAWAMLARHRGPDVSVWLIRLGLSRDLDLGRALCPAERARLAGFAVEDTAWTYAASHVSLRVLVGQALGQKPGDIRFAHPGDATQPPVLRDNDRLYPSLSHSGGFAAIALRRSGFVGVDIEPVARATDAEAVTDQFLSDSEIAGLTHLPRQERARRILALWSAKEAVLKAAGTGFSTDPRRVVFSAPDAPYCVQLDRRYHVRPLSHPRLTGLAGAVASPEVPPQGTLTLAHFDWILNQR